jgi:antitoxin component YwqK of YwqJK toxin-antitoxin module
MKESQLKYWIKLLSVIITFCVISCNVLKKQTVNKDSNEPHTYVNILFPNGDTIFIATVQNDKFNGPIKVKKEKGNYVGGMYDKIYEDAFSYNNWTYGNYRNDKKFGEWYYLNEQGVKTTSITYKNDTLNGAYLKLLNDGTDTLIFCNYIDGLLNGKYISNEGNGIINGVSLYGRHRWELSYLKGNLDGTQKKYYDGKLEEEMIFKNGQIVEIIFSDRISEHKISEHGDGYIQLDNASFAFGILGRQFCKMDNERLDLNIFGDDIFSGKIELCRGYFCPGELKLFSEISKKDKVFNIYFDVNIERKN